METIRWGIIGTGNIAKQFARGLAVLPDARLVAVGSRTQAAADAFGEMFDVPHRHARYEALAQDAEVDAVYVATPHSLHRANSVLCLEAGKAVLCEKPFTINAAEAEEIITLARAKGLFLMEAMWSRFMPLMVKLRALLAEGTIGEIHMLTADLGFRARFDPQSRLFNPALGGGALLDVGIYPLSLAYMVLGHPQHVSSTATLGQTGVDEQCALTLGYPGGQLALLYASIRATTYQEALLMGSKGRIRIHPRMFVPDTLTLTTNEGEETVVEEPFEGNGYNYEALEVMRCLRAGKRESDIMPLDESLAIMRTMDQVRAQWGLRYPME